MGDRRSRSGVGGRPGTTGKVEAVRLELPMTTTLDKRDFDSAAVLRLREDLALALRAALILLSGEAKRKG